MFLEEILAFDNVDWVKRYTFINTGGHHQSLGALNGTQKEKERRVSFSVFLSWEVHVFLLSNTGAPGSWILRLCYFYLLPPYSKAFDPRLGVTWLAPLVLKHLDSDWIIPLSFLVLQLADGRLWDFPASKLCKPMPIINLLFPAPPPLSSIGSNSLENPDQHR